MSGQPNRMSGWPAPVSQCPSMAAILAGWCSSVLRPCWSPATIWIGATSAAIHMAMENITRARFVGAVAQQVEGADGADHEGGGQIGGEHHVHEAIGERRIEDDRPPVGGHELAGGVDGVAGRRVHPAVGGQDPEGRQQRADGHHQRGEEVQAAADALHAEQHDAQEAASRKKADITS